MSKCSFFLLIIISVFLSCKKEVVFPVLEYSFIDFSMQSSRIEIEKSKSQLFCLTSYHCPLGIKQASKLNELYAKYGVCIDFYFVLPDKSVGDALELNNSFLSELTPVIYIDTGLLFSKRVDAKVTPEFFLFRDGKLIYSGPLDNTYTAINTLNIKSPFIGHLENALDSVCNNKKLKKTKLPAFGCYIEYGQ